MSGNDPALVKATRDLFSGYEKLTLQLLDDGLAPVDLPREVRAEDLGEAIGVIPTKYGTPAFVPVGTTNAFYNPGTDGMVVNRRIIYGTREHQESRNLYRRALDFVDKHAPERIRRILKPFYRNKLETLESEHESREQLTETGTHEFVHRKQNRTGILRYLLGDGPISDYVRNMVERHCIRYTSRIFRRRTGEGTYGVLEEQAIKKEKQTGIGPDKIFRSAELHGPRKAVKLAEEVYGLGQNRDV
jgi:hypothetical protein